MSDEAALCTTSMRLVAQNVRGLTPEKLEMIIHTMKDRGIHAAALQEAWAAAVQRMMIETGPITQFRG